MRMCFAAALLGGFFMAGTASADQAPPERSRSGFAEARPVCGPRDALARLLRTDWGERPIADAVTARGRHLVLFAAPDGATWSITVTSPGGTSCLIAAGVDWRQLAPAVPDAPQADTRTH